MQSTATRSLAGPGHVGTQGPGAGPDVAASLWELGWAGVLRERGPPSWHCTSAWPPLVITPSGAPSLGAGRIPCGRHHRLLSAVLSGHVEWVWTKVCAGSPSPPVSSHMGSCARLGPSVPTRTPHAELRPSHTVKSTARAGDRGCPYPWDLLLHTRHLRH